jgi:hypothetical protein
MEHHVDKLLEHYKDVNENVFFEHIQSCYLEQGCSKPKLIARLIEIFSQKYISKNVWLIEEFYKIVCHIFMAKPKCESLLQHLANCMLLLKRVGRRKVDLRNVKGSVDDVQRIIYRHDSSAPYNLGDLQTKVNENVYSLVHFIYHSWLTGACYEDMLIALTHVCNLPVKERKIDKDGTEISDYLWMRLVELATKLDDGRNDLIYKFTRIGKEMYYYKLTKKNSLERINLLYFCSLVMAQKDVRHEDVEYVKVVLEHEEGGHETKRKGRQTKQHKEVDCDYLFVVLDYDDDAMSQVRNDIERHTKYYFTEQTKRINGHELAKFQKHSVNIVKREQT